MNNLFSDARYTDKGITDYRENPLIDALPPILEFNDVHKKICNYPEILDEERNLSPKLRYHCIQRIFRYFQPWDMHFKLEEKVSIALMQGYIERNPMLPGYANDLSEIYTAYKTKNYQFSNVRMMQSCASGFTMVGFSGMGKTSAMNSILRIYPQVIVHKEYQGREFKHHQLVWLKLDCPFDGSVRGLCSNFLQEFDRIFDDNQYEQYLAGRHVSTDSLIPLMTSVAKRHSLGLLIIDEIQHLNAAKSGGYEKMLNFFVNLVNVIGIPVILIGTTKALGVLQSEFRQARRGSGHTGDVTWENMKNNKEWTLLVKGLFKYQWTKERVDLTDELNNILYDKSQGIVDIAVKLFAMSQMRAVSSGVEKITPQIINEVATENLKLVEPMINALRKKDKTMIMKFDDILPVDIDSYIAKEIEKIEKDSIPDIINGIPLNDAPQMTAAEVAEKVVAKLVECNIDMDTARKATIKVIKHKKKLPDLPVIINEALRQVFKGRDEVINPVKNMKELRVGSKMLT